MEGYNHMRSPHYGPAPGYDYDYYTPSPTPSPRHGPPFGFPFGAPPRTQRAHVRTTSYDFDARPHVHCPRFASDGQFATFVNVSPRSRKHSFSGPAGHSGHRPRHHHRRNSHSYFRPSGYHGESDEDEYVEIDGLTYVIPARSKSRRFEQQPHFVYSHGGDGYGYGTDDRHYAQTHGRRPSMDHQAGYMYDYDAGLGGYTSPNREHHRHSFHREAYREHFREAELPRESGHRTGHTRRKSTSTPQRPHTTRPTTSWERPTMSPRRQATEADAKKFNIPPGYAVKNWDPTEEPIFLLGSVFDSHSLGRWIFDWTVYYHGAGSPMAELAGRLWVSLIHLAGKVKRAEETILKIRRPESRELVDDFVTAGDRLMDKLQKLIKACEVPMLSAGKLKNGQMSKDSGVEFVRCLFGKDQELERTEKLMHNLDLWNLRFDANCEDILRKPTA